MAKIGFVGLGNMGCSMAINLVKAGHEVTGFDLKTAATDKLAAAGGLVGSNLQRVAADKDLLITMLQTGEQVLGVCQGAGGLYAHAKPGALHIDCSTIDVQSARTMHELAQNNQVGALDAPVSGGVLGAAAGTLTFMVGGDSDTLSRAQPFLAVMGQKIIHTGSAGSGQAAKICNNMILGISMVAISEAFILAEALGLTPQKLFEVVNSSSGQCWAMSKYAPVPGVLENVPANHDYQPGFAAAMMLKDLDLGQQVARTVAVDTPLGAKTTALYQQFIDQGCGALDFSGIIKQIASIHRTAHD